MVSIRPFEDGDNAAMLDIEKLCPQGNEKYAMGMDKSPDAVARYKVYDNWGVLAAEEEGRVAGWIGWTVKHHPVKGRRYVYLTEVNVHPEFQRKGIATKLVMDVEKNAQKIGSDYVYCYIWEVNDASKALFGKLGYSNLGDFKSCGTPVYKKVRIAQKFNIGRISKKDIGDVINLINNYYKGRTHFMPYTPESFKSYVNGIPAYGLENFWVVKDEGKIVACAGLWDSSVLGDIYFTKVPFTWKVMGGILGFLSIFTKMPKMPAEGEYIKTYYITDHAFDHKSPDAMLNLIAYFNNILLDAKRDFFGTGLDPSDPLPEVIKKLSPQIETFNVFAKALEGDLPDFSPLYIDVRDLIL